MRRLSVCPYAPRSMVTALTAAVGGAEKVDVRRQHHVVELLREHGRREESDCSQGLLAGIGEIMPHWRRKHEHAARPDRMFAAILKTQLTGAGQDILRLFGGIGVPAQATARLDFIDNGRRRGRPMSAVGGKRAGPADRRVVHSSDFRARKIVGLNDER